MKLSQLCTKKLHDIQKKIEVLIKDSSGNIVAEPFGKKDAAKPRKRSRKGEELLF